MSSRRQDICTLINTRFKGILTDNGYNSDIGRNMHAWRMSEFAESELPGATWTDDTADVEKPDKNMHNHVVDITVTVYCASGSTTPEAAREIIEDIQNAIGADPQWKNSQGVPLALRSLPGKNTIRMEQDNKTIGQVTVNFRIVYATKEWEF